MKDHVRKVVSPGPFAPNRMVEKIRGRDNGSIREFMRFLEIIPREDPGQVFERRDKFVFLYPPMIVVSEPVKQGVPENDQRDDEYKDRRRIDPAG